MISGYYISYYTLSASSAPLGYTLQLTPMNKLQFERNRGSVCRLRPPVKDAEDNDLDDNWLIEDISETAVTLKHVPTGALLFLGFDHIKERMSDPPREELNHFGFLVLNVEVHRGANGEFVAEPIVPRAGRAFPPRQTQTKSGGSSLTWPDIEVRFKELRQRELADAHAGNDRLVSAWTHAEPGEPDRWLLMGGSKDTRADVNRLCRIAGSRLSDPKWQRRESDAFDRWLQFVVEVGEHTRHLHSSSFGADQPPVERDDYWISDLVAECLGAVREALAREETGNYLKPEIPQPAGTEIIAKQGHPQPSDSRIAVSLQAGTARLGPSGLATKPTVDLVVTNEGAPFLLVVHAKLVRASIGLERMESDQWEYEPRHLKGGAGKSWFHVATLEHTQPMVPGQWVVGVRAEQMMVVRRWEGTGEMFFQIEWSFFRETDSTLHLIRKDVGLFILNEEHSGFEWELTSE